MKKLEELTFNNTYVRLGEPYFSRVMPTPAPEPYLVAFNSEAARLLDLDANEASRPEFLQYFSGHRLWDDSDPIAMVYSGHQFGVRVPRLGDGRAILLGEVNGAGGLRWDLHLKGSGLTPYSRQGDGRAVLRSSIREYLCGEAMHGLGIPTTRTLCIVGSNEMVFRETIETRALITRLAPSHVRFGSFEYFYFHHQSDQKIQKERLAQLADYVIAEHFPQIQAEFEPGPERYAAWLKEVCARTARLIAQWQAVGFAHGVMNTDNMSILGLTLDYGPFGFMEEYTSGFICNHSDDGGRYAFSEQPSVGLWNLNILARVLLPLMSVPLATVALETYEPTFVEELLRLLRAKLGLRRVHESDGKLFSDLFEVMGLARVDYTIFFRSLGKLKLHSDTHFESEKMMLKMFEEGCVGQSWNMWVTQYRERLKLEGACSSDDADREIRMNRVNPKFVLRNYLAQVAIDEATQKGTYLEVDRLLQLLRNPFDEHVEMENYAKQPPDWGKHLVVSCSS